MWTPKSSSGLLRTALPGPQDSDLLLIYPLDEGVVTTEPRSWDFRGEGRNATENAGCAAIATNRSISLSLKYLVSFL